ncbi:MAG: hypothetical protein VKK42_19075 [Lyngbya sp.]|nr:hypothetical protein [Lyngbya sp.]
MLVSTFELLLKPITPVEGNIPGSARTVLQGYFLTIANPNDTPLRLRLQFSATTPNLNLDETITIRDVVGTNEFGDLVPTSDPRKFNYNLSLPAHDTALVILQPDITRLNPNTDRLEIRGYVEIFLEQRGLRPVNVLLTPEHRGTFVNKGIMNLSEFDQLVYSLPTATGSSLFQLVSRPKDGKEIKPEIKEIKEFKEFKEIPDDIKVRDIPEINKPNPDNIMIPNPEIQQALGLMAQTIDNIQQRLEQNGEAFISSEERPAVGEQALNQG